MQLNEQQWEQVKQVVDKIQQNVEEKEKLAKFSGEKEVTTNGIKYTQKMGTVDGIGCIYAKLNIKCNDLDKVIDLDSKSMSIVDQQTPKEQRHGLAIREVLQCPQCENTSVIHQINESPVMLVSSRSFVFVRHMIKSGNTATFYVQSFDCDAIKDQVKAVRGQIYQYQKYTKIDDNNILGEAFYYVDPKGSIPLKLFNTQLEGQISSIRYIKKTIEKQNVE